MGRKRFRINCSPDKWGTSLPEKRLHDSAAKIEKTSEFQADD
jgi:hypothetical protein